MLLEIIYNWRPVLVYFTIGLFSISTLLIVMGLFVKSNFGAKLSKAGYMSLRLGCFFTFVTLMMSWYALCNDPHELDQLEDEKKIEELK